MPVHEHPQPLHHVRPHDFRISHEPIAESRIVASDAAHETGLPPNVLACDQGGHDMTAADAVITQSGSPDAIPFPMLTMSGSTPECSIANIRPVRPMPDCTSSTMSRIPCCRVRSRSRCRNVWRNDVAALALYWLDDQRRHFVRRHEVHEKLLLDEVETLGGAGIRSCVDRTAVTVGVWRVIRPRNHRRKAFALDHLACRRRKEPIERP